MSNQDGSELRISDIMLLDVWKMRRIYGSKDADIAEVFNRWAKGKPKRGCVDVLRVDTKLVGVRVSETRMQVSLKEHMVVKQHSRRKAVCDY